MTYISKIAKNGKMQYFRVDEDGKKKMVKRSEYDANMPAGNQIQLFSEPDMTVEEPAATFAEIEVTSGQPSVTEPEYSPEPIPERPVAEATNEAPAVTSPFDFIKTAVEDVVGRYKLTYKEWKKYGSVYYRSCAICGFNLDDNGNVTAVKFMGTTLETRKTVTEREVKTAADWEYIRQSVIRQIEFVNEWWNPSEKTA